MGKTDGPASVNIPTLGIVTRTGGRRDELLLPEEDKLGELYVDVTEGGDKGVGGDDAPEWVDDKGEGNGKEVEDKVESEGTAEARAAIRRMRAADKRMDVQQGAACELVAEESANGGKGGPQRRIGR